MAEARARRQFEFLEWTADNHLRHSKFVGFREDKLAKDVAREMSERLGRPWRSAARRVAHSRSRARRVQAIESASFLTEDQRRDIFYNNAVRFLRLDVTKLGPK